MIGLGDLEGGDHRSMGLGISDGGKVVVGRAVSEGEILQGFRWQDGVMSSLGEPIRPSRQRKPEAPSAVE